MPNLFLQANTTPVGTEFPATVDELLQLIAQYISVEGIGDFNGINFGSDTPAVGDRDKPWLETDPGTGSPVRWRVWNGSEWEELVYPWPNGTSGQRPALPGLGQPFWDTDLQRLLVWDGIEWITAEGAPGDIMFCNAPTIERAEELNPGWLRLPSAYGRVLGGAGFGSGLTPRSPGETVSNDETVKLTSFQSGLRAHFHGYGTKSGSVDDDGGTQVTSSRTDMPTVDDSSNNQTDARDAHNNMQPTIFYWVLQKKGN